MKKILVWDNNGTITALKNPNDTTTPEKVILPGVAEKMQEADLNVVISGFKSVESEKQNYGPEKVIRSFTSLMEQLPISAAAFSPAIGGVACYVLIKKGNDISVLAAHEHPKYARYIGKFKKPDIGMFVVMRDVIAAHFGMSLTPQTSMMIGDTWHDEKAARAFGIPFCAAETVHNVN